ncbi:MAG: ABC transporter ATP-binding protein [Chthonomonadales bacterium]
MSSTKLISANNLVKHYHRGTETIRAVDGISFEVDHGEFISIVGPSGAGKTTLLQLIGAMDTPTSGSLKISDRETARMNDRELTLLRQQSIGFVFQSFGLIPTLTVEENIALPATFSGKKVGPVVKGLLERVGLGHRRTHRPNELSGGEMQRVAIARSLVHSPPLLLADEPTGNLDSTTSEKILELLQDLRRDGLTVIIVTHNQALAARADRTITIVDGKIVA